MRHNDERTVVVVSGMLMVAATAMLVGGTARAQAIGGPGASALAPATSCTSPFADVADDSMFCPSINSITSLGVMFGCGGNYFCPGEYLMREDMAVYLEKLYRGSSYTPGPPVSDPFYDVTKTYLLAGWMKVLSCDGVTAGCGSGNYCPYKFVSRWEMAVFLAEVISWRLNQPIPTSGYAQGHWYNCTSQPPYPVSTSAFGDVAWNDGGCPFIHYIYAKGVTAGCNVNPLRFCPSANVPRDQMAAFVNNAYIAIGGAPFPGTPCL